MYSTNYHPSNLHPETWETHIHSHTHTFPSPPVWKRQYIFTTTVKLICYNLCQYVPRFYGCVSSWCNLMKLFSRFMQVSKTTYMISHWICHNLHYIELQIDMSLTCTVAHPSPVGGPAKARSTSPRQRPPSCSPSCGAGSGGGLRRSRNNRFCRSDRFLRVTAY